MPARWLDPGPVHHLLAQPAAAGGLAATSAAAAAALAAASAAAALAAASLAVAAALALRAQIFCGLHRNLGPRLWP